MRTWLILPLLSITAQAHAQDAPVPAPAVTPDLLALGSDGNRMTVPVSIAGAGPYRFIIDTGAQRTVISRELAGTLGLARGRDVRLTAMTGTSTSDTVVIPSLSVSRLSGPRVEAPALERVNLGAPGMLGIDTLQGQAVSIDFDRGEMAVQPSTRRRHHADALPNEIVVRAKSMFGQLVVTDAYCDGQRVRVILDTGSVVSMGNEALRRRFVRGKRVLTPVTLVSVTGGVLQADQGEIAQIKIGDLTIQHLPMAFADAPPFRRFGLGDSPAILLGMDALKLFRRVQIDFANREVRLAMPRDARSTPDADGIRSVDIG